MARNERYVTTIELNSEQAQDHLKQLEKHVESLRKKKEEALKSKGFFNEQELTDAIKKFDQFKFQIEGTGKAMANVAEVSTANLRKSLRKLKDDSSHMLPDSEEWQEKQNQIDEINSRIKELRNSTRETREESEELSANIENLSLVLKDLKGASLNQLSSAQKYLENEMADERTESGNYKIQLDQLKQVKTRIQDIKLEQQQVNSLVDQYNREINQSQKEVANVAEQNKIINNTLKNISSASVRDLEYSIKMLNEQMRVMDRGTAYDEMQKKVKELRTELEKTRYEGKASQGVLSRTADFFNKLQGSVIVGVAGFNKLREVIIKSTDAFAKMDQEMQNVRKYTGQTTEQLHEMNEEFKKLDTRTSRERLNQLAGDAGRLGIQGKEAIMEFVDAADKINVALGDDLGENAVKNIGKLSMTFGTDKTMGLRGAMLATGSAINELAQNSSASAGYLVDFTARVAGFGKQVGLTQSQIMGFGAVMDENMLRDEMAATAFGQLLVKMTTDLDTFARLTGLKVEEYKKLVTEDINAAILAVASSLKGRDMQDLGKVFDAMNLDGQRAIGVLSTLGDKVNDVAERQRIASNAFKEGSSVIEEFNIQNDTVQARLEKARKEFHDIAVELGEKLIPIARYGISGTSMIIRLLSGLIEICGKYRSVLITITATISALIVAENLDIAKKKLQVLWTDKLVKATSTLWKVMARHPLIMVGAAIAGVIAFLADFNKKGEQVVKTMDDIGEAEKAAAKSASEEKNKLDVLYRAISDVNVKMETRRGLIADLRKLYPAYFKDLTDEEILTGKAAKAYRKLSEEIIASAKARAYEDKMKEISSRNADIEEEISEETKWLNANWDKYDKAKKKDQGVYGDVSLNRRRFIEEYDRRAQAVIDKQNTIKENDKKLKNLATKAAEARPAEERKEVDKPEPLVDPKAEEKARKAAETAAKKLEAKKKAELKALDDAAKAQTENDLAIAMGRYARGESDYRKYISEIDRIQMDGFNKRLAIYNEESDEYKKILNDRETYFLKSVERQERMNQREVEMVHQSVVAELQSKQWDDEGAYLEAMYQEDINYLQNKAALYRKGSEERVEIEEEITEREYQHQLERQQRYAEMVEELKENYLNMGNDRLQAIALNGLEELRRQGLIKVEEYEKAKIAIQAQYASTVSPDEQTKQTGSQMLTNAQGNVNKNAQAEGTSYSTPIVGTIRRYQATMEQLKILYGNDEKNHAAYLAAKAQATSEFCQQLAIEFQAAYSSINQIMSATSSLYSAQAEYETAMVKKKYEKQIEAAGKNQKKVKKLQEKQAKEEAAIKNKYNAKQMKIQIAQAFAQMAVNSLQAYGAGLSVGGPAAPIVAAAFASMALAAGMIQIAAIQKQQAAQQAGYYEGGFTGGRRYKKEAGVVHEGEFVANHRAVNNPNVRPVLDFIDQAQRNNRVGSLTADDISRQLGNGGAAVVAPVVNVSADNEELKDSLERSREVNERLLTVIEEHGIHVDFPLDSFHKSYKHFQILNER